MSNTSETKTVEVPQRVLRSMIAAYQKWEEFSDELEDFVFSTAPDFVQKMRGARREHLRGRTRPLHELKRELR